MQLRAPEANRRRARELWPTVKTLLVISKFKELKEDLRLAIREKKHTWETLADIISKEFNCVVTATQVENK